MKKLKLEDFKLYSKKEIDYFLELNKNLEINVHEVEGLRYMQILNILKRPDQLKDFLVQFPTESRTKSLLDNEETNVDSKSPGFQQGLDYIFFKSLSENLFLILKENKFCKYEYSNSNWRYYTNCCYPNMPAYNKNYLPHVDSFTYALNIFLTDVPNTATSFFKYKNGEKEFYSMDELYRNVGEFNKFPKKYVNNNGIGKWVAFEGDENFEIYHKIPALFNSCSIYRGNRWHSIYYDAENSSEIRYSLVGAIE